MVRIAALALFFAAACGDRMAVEYRVCGLGKCEVTAMFADTDTCERYAKYSSAYCDQTNPSGMVCRFSKPGDSPLRGECLKR